VVQTAAITQAPVVDLGALDDFLARHPALPKVIWGGRSR
jgi:hypothetical protein